MKIYTETSANSYKCDGVSFIPKSETNIAYKNMLAEVAAGTAEIASYSAPALAAPAVVTMRQARLALLSTGRLADVETAIAGMPEPDKTAATIEWEYSQTVERDRPFVTALAGLLSLTETDLDDLFTLASTL